MWLAICVNILDYLWSPLSLTAKKMVTSADPWPWPRGDCSLVSLSMVWWTKSTSSDHTLKISICVPGCCLILNLRKKNYKFFKTKLQEMPHFSWENNHFMRRTGFSEIPSLVKSDTMALNSTMSTIRICARYVSLV